MGGKKRKERGGVRRGGGNGNVNSCREKGVGEEREEGGGEEKGGEGSLEGLATAGEEGGETCQITDAALS